MNIRMTAPAKSSDLLNVFRRLKIERRLMTCNYFFVSFFFVCDRRLTDFNFTVFSWRMAGSTNM